MRLIRCYRLIANIAIPGEIFFLSYEEARANLQDVIEGNVMLALQLGLEIPQIEGVEIKENGIPPTHPPQNFRLV